MASRKLPYAKKERPEKQFSGLFVWSPPPRYAGGAKKLTALPMSVKLLLIC